MQIYREWEVSYWDENAKAHVDSGIENVTLLEDRSAHQFMKQVAEKYPGPNKYRITWRWEDGSIEQALYEDSRGQEYPSNMLRRHEFRRLFLAHKENYLDMLNFVQESWNPNIRDLIVALWDALYLEIEFEDLLFIRDWFAKKISSEVAETKLKALIDKEEWKIPFQMREAHESGIPPSQFLPKYRGDYGLPFLIMLLRKEFQIERDFTEIWWLVDNPEELDLIF